MKSESKFCEVRLVMLPMQTQEKDTFETQRVSSLRSRWSKESTCTRETGFNLSDWEDFGEGRHRLQYSCLRISMDREPVGYSPYKQRNGRHDWGNKTVVGGRSILICILTVVVNEWASYSWGLWTLVTESESRNRVSVVRVAVILDH